MSVLLDGVGTMTTRNGKVVAAAAVVVAVHVTMVGTRISDLRHRVPDEFGRAVAEDLRRRIAVVVAEDCPVEDRLGGDHLRREEAISRVTVTGEHRMVGLLVGEPR